MIEWIKKFWEEKGVGEVLSIAAGLTVALTCLGVVLWGAWQIVSLVLEATRMIWLVYGWVIGSFGFIGYALVIDYRRYTREVEEGEES